MSTSGAPLAFVRKHALNIALLVALAGGSIYLLVDRGSVSTSEQEARKKNLFPAWRKDDVTHVTLRTPAAKIELTRRGGTASREWAVAIDGASYAADDQAVDKLLETLEYASFVRAVPKGNVDRASFGLDSPRSQVDIEMGALKFSLAIGKPTATSNEVYAEVADRGVYAVGMALVNALEVDPAELRSKSFVPYFSVDLEEIDLSGKGGERAFVRGNWSGGRGSGFRVKSESGDGVRVDGNALDRVLVAFGRMQATTFLDQATADLASKPEVTVTLLTHEKQKAVLAVGGACPTKKDQIVAVRREPDFLAVCVPDEVLAPLQQPMASFEDNALIGASSDEITEVRILDPEAKKLEIARSGAGFVVRSPTSRTISGARGGAFLKELLDARGEVLPAGTALPSGTPTEVRILSQGGLGPGGGHVERTEELSIYPASEGSQVVLRKEDQRALKVAVAATRAFAVSDLLVRDLKLFSLKPDDLDSVSVDGGGKKQRIERQKDGVTLVEPKGKGLHADVGFVSALLEKIAGLETTAWVADRDDGSFGLGTPRFTIEAHTAAISKADAGPPETITILLGAKTDDGSYAKLGSDPAVFIAPPELEHAASTWLVSRSDFLVPTSSIDRLTLIGTDAKKLELVRDGKELRVTTGTDPRPAPTHAGSEKRRLELAADVGQAFDALIPLAAVSIGEPLEHQGFKKPALTIEIAMPSGKSTITLGASDTFEGTTVYYARRNDVDATYVVPRSEAQTLIDATSTP